MTNSHPAVPRPPVKLRAADQAYEAIEGLISTLRLEPGAPIVEAELVELTQLGRTRCAKPYCAWCPSA